jgi:hypothetical protein
MVFALAGDSTITKDLVLDELDFAINKFQSIIFSPFYPGFAVTHRTKQLFTKQLSAIFTIKFRIGQIQVSSETVKTKQFLFGLRLYRVCIWLEESHPQSEVQAWG